MFYETNFQLVANSEKPAPFFSWVGGKRRLASQISKDFPDRVSTYWEPFVGGGAVYWYISDYIDHAVLSDKNRDLIISYKVVKNWPKELIDALEIHKTNHYKDEGYFDHIKELQPENDIDIAAKFVYLLNTCFNSIYRMRKDGGYLVHKAGHLIRKIYDADNIMLCSKALQKAEIALGDYRDVVCAGKDDLIYCDPPYYGSVDIYAHEMWTDGQKDLRDEAKKWLEAGANVYISNSQTPYIREIYDGFDFRPLVRPSFSCRKNDKTYDPEVIISLTQED